MIIKTKLYYKICSKLKEIIKKFLRYGDSPWIRIEWRKQFDEPDLSEDLCNRTLHFDRSVCISVYPGKHERVQNLNSVVKVQDSASFGFLYLCLHCNILPTRRSCILLLFRIICAYYS